MTRRTLAINWGDNLFVSQEFNGDRKEAQMFGLKSAKPFWEDVVEKFKGVRTVRAFERTLEEVEQMYAQPRSCPLLSLSEREDHSVAFELPLASAPVLPLHTL